jgi:hypothetical protein
MFSPPHADPPLPAAWFLQPGTATAAYVAVVGCTRRILTLRCSEVLQLLLLLVQDGDTPLICASYNGHLEVVRKLLAAGADVAVRNKVSARGRPGAAVTAWLTALAA